MKAAATDWEAVALEKLTKVLGEQAGRDLALSVHRELGIERIDSAAKLRAFAAALSTKAGFAAAVGGLLGVHAAMYDDT